MDKLLQKMQTHGVVLDTNLLVLLIVGLADIHLVAQHKKLNSYNETDFKLLVAILDKCKKIVITPHILAETSNLVTFGMHGDNETKVFFALRLFMERENFLEIHTHGKDISNKEGYLKFGLSDIGLLETLKSESVLLTDDYKLSGYAEKRNFETLNFNHLKYGY